MAAWDPMRWKLHCPKWCSVSRTVPRPSRSRCWTNHGWRVWETCMPPRFFTWPKFIPVRPAIKFRKNQWQRIHQQMVEVLQLAIEHEGSTLSDGTYRNALNDPGSYQNQHCVYDREGQRCPTCLAAKIQRIVQAQRSTFYCKQCQKR